MNAIKNLIRFYKCLGRGGEILALISTITMSVVVIFTIMDVLGRNLFGTPILNIYGMTEQAMVAVVFFSLVLVEFQDRNIAVDILYNYLSSRRQFQLRVLWMLLATALLAIMVWQSGLGFIKSLRILETDMGYPPLPIYPFKGILFLNMILLFTLFAVKSVLSIAGLSSGVERIVSEKEVI